AVGELLALEPTQQRRGAAFGQAVAGVPTLRLQYLAVHSDGLGYPLRMPRHSMVPVRRQAATVLPPGLHDPPAVPSSPPSDEGTFWASSPEPSSADDDPAASDDPPSGDPPPLADEQAAAAPAHAVSAAIRIAVTTVVRIVPLPRLARIFQGHHAGWCMRTIIYDGSSLLATGATLAACGPTVPAQPSVA